VAEWDRSRDLQRPQPGKARAHDPAGDSIGPLLVAEEALTAPFVRELAQFLEQQPPWSDLPILILTGNSRDNPHGHRLEYDRLSIGSPVLLERPIRPAMLISSVRAALRARQRQYEIRDILTQRDTARADQKQADSSLHRSDERFRRLIEHSSVGFIIGDLDGGISYANPALLNLLGYSPDEVASGSLRWDTITPPEYADADQKAIEELRASGTAESYQKALRARDGRLIPFLIGATVIPSPRSDESSGEVAVFITDLSSQKKAESALIQSEKLAAVGRLAASISHEINNPLEAVTNLLYLARRSSNLPDEVQSLLSTADQELQRVSQIAAQTLRFHRQSTKPREITPEELLEPTLALYNGRLLNSNIELELQHRRAGSLTCYEGDIRQVLNNLIGNAIDSMRTGGRLIVRTSKAWLADRITRKRIPAVRITIADTGYGMPAHVKARIYEPFYTTKGDNGTGLGLWISRGIIDKHHGALQAHSRTRQPVNGTVFSLVLPSKPAWD